jgi:Tfp pilus assembly protein PilW
MISVMSIYISSTDISLKTDINRAMQENIKNAVETIAEDVRKNGSNGIKVHLADTVCTSPSVNRHIS